MYLNVHSVYSLRYGTLPIGELAERAAALGIASMALTDINNSTGAMEFCRACRAKGIKPVTGIEFRRDGRLLYIGIARNREGMRELNEFLTWHNLHGQPLPDDPWAFRDVFVIYPFGARDAMLLREHEFLGVRPGQLNKLFGLPLASWKHKLVALCPVTVGDKVQHRLHQYLRAIDGNALLSRMDESAICQKDETFRPPGEILDIYRDFPYIIASTNKLLDSCDMAFAKEKKNKRSYLGSEAEDVALLRRLTWEGMAYRYGVQDEVARTRITKELQTIEQLGYTTYFLITWDFIQYAMSKGYYHVGRGSGANSTVAYCLRITDVDPIALDLYFERFINSKRTSPPDFDIDFSWNQREDIQRYIFEKYNGAGYHVALLGTISDFKERSVIREIGKVMGLPKSEIDDFCDPALEAYRRNDPTFKKIERISQLMCNMPNQRSIHAGGMLISEEPLTYYTALDLPPKGMATVQWDMYEAEAIGYDKYDVLSQRGLGHIRDAVQLVEENQGVSIDIHDVKRFMVDAKLNARLKTGNTIGCFYIESPAMRQLLGKLGCGDYTTLIAASSIIRPGVASSGMMKTYIHNYHHPEEVKYLHPVMKEQLSETFGVMVYQEDVIKICYHYAGLDLTDADVLRRAMSGKYRSKDEFKKIVSRFFDGAKALGRDEEITREVWRQVSSFAGYSFAKGHSASFAVESYQSLFLKTYFPKEFMVAVLNNYGGFYRRPLYISELKKAGAKVHLPSVNHSEAQDSIRGDDVYLGFIGLLGLEQQFIDAIPRERHSNGLFANLEDFVRRTFIGLEQALLLIRVGALRFTGKSRKSLLWEVYQYLGKQKKVLPHKELFKVPVREYHLPPLESSPLEEAFVEMELLGFPLSRSVFDMLKTSFRGEVMSRELAAHVGKVVRMVGEYVCDKTVRTINGKKMWFGTFLDVEGSFFDTTHFPDSAPYYPFQGMGCYLIQGLVVQDFGVYSIEVQRFAKLPFVSPD